MTLILCLSIILSGCAGKKADESKTVTQQTTTQQTTKDDSIVTAPGQFPVVKEKITIKAFAGLSPYTEDLQTNEFTKWYEEKTNVNVDWIQVPHAQRLEKLNVLMAGGDYPDVLMNSAITEAQVTLYGEQGIFVPLNDYIEKHGYFIKEMFKESPYVIDRITYNDGNIYSLPQVVDNYHVSACQKMWIYKPWLDKLGLQMPTTTEEFRQVLKAFKTKDPNGNGKADEIPLAGVAKAPWQSWIDGFLIQPFIYHDFTNYLEKTDNKIRFVAYQEEWREALKYIHSLYEEGLIAPESFTQDGNQLKQMGENPDVPILGAVPAMWYGVFTATPGESGRYLEYVAVPPLKGPTGLQQTMVIAPQVNPHTLVTKNCKHPEVIVRWIDWFYSAEGNISGWQGIEGKGWVKAKPGDIGAAGAAAKFTNGWDAGLNLRVPYGKIQNIAWENTATQYNSKGFLESKTISGVDLEKSNDYRLMKSTDLYNPYKKKELIPPLKMTSDQSAIIAANSVNISNYIRENAAKFITGKLDLNADWSNYVKGFESLKVDEYVKIYQDVYNASLNKK